MQLWKFQVTIVLKSNNLCKHVTKRSRREDTDEAWERKVVNSRKKFSVSADVRTCPGKMADPLRYVTSATLKL
ncbi:uncharacterized protein LOC143151373 isoform X2 [Ptiloglossa arizonensis]|uniref:uncharacterized protein LOC143151373 isoform X2 n=1 Tax=Ptiloglossa arizonensis TaxID=3350558 RepID=UPI003F9EF4F0